VAQATGSCDASDVILAGMMNAKVFFVEAVRGAACVADILIEVARL